MSLPKQAGRWFALLLLALILPVFVRHPAEVVWVIAAGLFLITAWHLFFGSPRSLTKKGKDRTFRNPPWM